MNLVRSTSLIVALAMPLALLAAPPQIGDSRAEVQAALGAPQGEVRLGERHVLYFAAGSVELRNGAVAHVALLSPEELENRRARAVAAEEQARERVAQLAEEGEALKAKKLADPAFQAAPLGYQITYWENFTRRYPMVSCVDELDLARARFAEEETKASQAERVAELEERLSDAEARADAGRAYFWRPRYDRDGLTRHPFTLWPIRYRYYEAPLPVVTTPGLPPLPPKFRAENTSPSPAARERGDFSDDDDRPRRRFGRSS